MAAAAATLAAPLAVYYELPTAMAAVYGALIAMGNAGLEAWHQRRAQRIAGTDAGHNLRIMFRCVTERFVWTLAALVLAFGMLKLQPLAVVGGFTVALMAHYFAILRTRV